MPDPAAAAEPRPDHHPDPRHDLRRLPLDAIDEAALQRDRTVVDAGALDELTQSIAATGLRQPIEVFPLDAPAGAAPRFGLISGWRRLAAMRTLHEHWGMPGCDTIPAFVRAPTGAAAALAAMVEENAIREDVSPWEQGRLIVAARDAGHFASFDAAVDALHANVHRSKRIRLRQLATLVDELDGSLLEPERLSQRNCLRLAEACQRGFAELIRATLLALPHARRPAQWDAIAPILREMETAPAPGPTARPGRPRRTSQPHPGLRLRREKTRSGYAIHFSGPDASDDLMDAVFFEIDRMFGPG